MFTEELSQADFYSRVLTRGNTVRLGEGVRQLEGTRFRATPAGCWVMISEHLDDTKQLRNNSGRWGATAPREIPQ